MKFYTFGIIASPLPKVHPVLPKGSAGMLLQIKKVEQKDSTSSGQLNRIEGFVFSRRLRQQPAGILLEAVSQPSTNPGRANSLSDL